MPNDPTKLRLQGIPFTVVSISIGVTVYRNQGDARFPKEAPRAAPPHCPVCAHALSLRPDLSTRTN